MVLGLVALIVLGALCGWIVRRKHQKVGHFTTGIVIIVWCIYILHGVLMLFSIWWSIWPIQGATTILFVSGLILMVLGIFYCTSGMLKFRSFKRMMSMETSMLITSGIYRWCRNPQNVGWGLFIVGIALISKSGFCLCLAALFWIGFVLYVPDEEKYLEQLYGESYRQYASVSPRFFGWPKNRNESKNEKS